MFRSIVKILFLSALAIGTLSAGTACAGVPKTNVDIDARPIGTLDSTCPLGDCTPEPEELAWDDDALTAAMLTSINRTVGDPQVSLDVRQFALGDEADTGSIVLTQKTGDVTLDWFTEPLLTDLLLFDCDASPGAGEGAFRMRIVGTGGAVTSRDQFSWICEEAPVGGTEINANLGHYFQTGRAGSSRNFAYRRDTLYPLLLDNTAFLGVAVERRWIDFEVTQGNCTPGLNAINAEIDVLQTYPGDKKLVIQWRDEKQNQTFATRDALFPEYLNSSYHAIYEYEGAGATEGIPLVTWDSTDAQAKAAFFAMWTCIADGLKANTENYEDIEGFRLNHESAEGASTNPVNSPGYDGNGETTAEHIAWYTEFATFMRATFPTKMIWISINTGLGGTANNEALRDAMIPLDVLVGISDSTPRGGSPNTTLCKNSAANAPSTAFEWPTINSNIGQPAKELTGAVAGTTDRRDLTGIVLAVEGSELGQGVFCTYRVSEQMRFMNQAGGLEPDYVFWDMFESSTTNCNGTFLSGSVPRYNSQDAETCILPAVEANPTLDQAGVPPHYP